MRMKAAAVRVRGHPIETVDADPPGTDEVLNETIGAVFRQVPRPRA
jgi:hypothetical protein